MNCKEGDLAVVVRSIYGNFGKLVRVVRASKGNGVPRGMTYTDSHGTTWRAEGTGMFIWEVEAMGAPLVKVHHHYTFCDVGDAYLRPITPPAGTITTDEVIELYAPKVPAKESA